MGGFGEIQWVEAQFWRRSISITYVHQIRALFRPGSDSHGCRCNSLNLECCGFQKDFDSEKALVQTLQYEKIIYELQDLL